MPTRWTRRGLWLCAILAAALSHALAKESALQQRAPHCVAEQTRDLIATIRGADWPDAPGEPERVRLDIEVLDDKAPYCVDLTGRRLRLNWHFPPILREGEIWRFAAEVRVPWGYQNPGGFDYERWLMANGINGTGYIRNAKHLADSGPTLRQRAHAGIAEQVAPHRNRGHLLALAAGSGRWLTDDDWLLLRRTGTVHLLVVSGLHIGLVAALGLAAGFGIARLLPWSLPWLPGGWVAATVALSGAAGFVWLSGAGVPAVRAGVMCIFGVLAFVAGRSVAPGRWLALAAIAVVCAEPLALLTHGFWLSFAAVALLIGAFANRAPRHGRLPGLVRAQWVMVLGMTPLVALIGGETAPAAGLANLFAVPWVSFLVVPLVLLALLASLSAPPLAELCWFAADAALSSLLGYLNWLEGPGAHRLPIGLGQGIPCLFALGCLLCACKWRGVLACLPLYAAGLVVLDQRPPFGEARVTSLDVGQGSAILVDTRRHRLLYDAGMRFSSGFDLGEAVVLPAIAATGPPKLDAMIVSHGDADHAGGARAVLDGIAVDALIADVSGLGGRPCRRGERWTWDGVDFAILHPSEASALRGNDASCVLSVAARGGRALLPGDIEIAAELRLLTQGLEPVDLLFAPHHGSNTSSSRRFIAALEPRIAVAMAGFGNRYGHPHPAVAQRYGEIGARVWITGRDGALTWWSNQPHRIEARRLGRRSPWHWWTNQPERPHQQH